MIFKKETQNGNGVSNKIFALMNLVELGCKHTAIVLDQFFTISLDCAWRASRSNLALRILSISCSFA